MIGTKLASKYIFYNDFLLPTWPKSQIPHPTSPTKMGEREYLYIYSLLGMFFFWKKKISKYRSWPIHTLHSLLLLLLLPPTQQPPHSLRLATKKKFSTSRNFGQHFPLFLDISLSNLDHVCHVCYDSLSHLLTKLLQFFEQSEFLLNNLCAFS